MDGFIFYTDFDLLLRGFSLEQKGLLLDACIAYTKSRKLPDFNGDDVVEGVFLYIKNRMDENFKKWQTSRENGAKGGRPKKPRENPEETQKEPGENLKVKVKAKGKVKTIYNPPISPLAKSHAEKNDLDFSNCKHADLLKRFSEHRKEIRKPMTQKALEIADKKLEQMARDGPEKAEKAVENSIMNGWMGLFEPDPGKAQGKSRDHMKTEEGIPL